LRISNDRHLIVLAAGQGRRMAGPKALMEVSGRPWWQTQRQRLDPLGIPQTWVLSSEVEKAMLAAGPLPFRSVRGYADSPMFQSIMRGIDSLVAAPPEGVFVLPVDVPGAGKPVWDALCNRDEVSRPTYVGAHGHPVYLPWRWIDEVLRPGHAQSEATRPLRLDALIAPVVRDVPVKDPAVSANLNTPEDMRRWLALGAGASAP
jgi:CTP:molybdopterin cytidylyltransferase MocA